MKRRSSTTATPLAIDRTLEDTAYDTIELVADSIDNVNVVGDAITDGSLDDITSIIDMEVATGAEGTDAVWDGTTLTIPIGDTGAEGYTPIKGVDYVDGTNGTNGTNGTDSTVAGPNGSDGTNGSDGLTPVYEFTYNEGTGDLEYTLVNNVPINSNTVVEW